MGKLCSTRRFLEEKTDVWLSRELFFFKRNGSRVNAVTQTCWCWAVGKHMSQMATAVAAQNLSPAHSMTGVIFFAYHWLTRRCVKTRPTTACIKFCCRLEQGFPTSATQICAIAKNIPIFAGKRPLRPLLSANAILFWRELFKPIGLIIKLWFGHDYFSLTPVVANADYSRLAIDISHKFSKGLYALIPAPVSLRHITVNEQH